MWGPRCTCCWRAWLHWWLQWCWSVCRTSPTTGRMLGQHDCKTYTWVRNYLLQSYRDWKFPIDKSRARFHWSFSKLCDRNIFIIAATIKFSDNLSDYFQHIRVSKLNILVLITPTSSLSRPIPIASVKLSPQALRLGSITTGRDFYSNSDIYHIWT